MNRSAFRSSLLLLGVAFGAAAALAIANVGCDDSSGVHEIVDSGGGHDAGGSATDGAAGNDGAPSDDCVKNPTTYEDILNACTDAAKIDKHPVLPNLLPDGGLPPLK